MLEKTRNEDGTETINVSGVFTDEEFKIHSEIIKLILEKVHAKLFNPFFTDDPFFAAIDTIRKSDWDYDKIKTAILIVNSMRTYHSAYSKMVEELAEKAMHKMMSDDENSLDKIISKMLDGEDPEAEAQENKAEGVKAKKDTDYYFA